MSVRAFYAALKALHSPRLAVRSFKLAQVILHRMHALRCGATRFASVPQHPTVMPISHHDKTQDNARLRTYPHRNASDVNRL